MRKHEHGQIIGIGVGDVQMLAVNIYSRRETTLVNDLDQFVGNGLRSQTRSDGIKTKPWSRSLRDARRGTGRMCFDTVYTDLDDMEGFRKDVEMIKTMGFDGKSIINPRQIPVCHEVFTPNEKQIRWAEAVVREIDTKKAMGIGVFTLNGKMLDVAFYDGAKRTIALAKAAGVYKGDL